MRPMAQASAITAQPIDRVTPQTERVKSDT
jgi:hypothetical protein